MYNIQKTLFLDIMTYINMQKSIIQSQKEDLERLRKLPLISRDIEVVAKKYLSSDLIKVILGPRRAGKSVLAFLLLRDTSFGYVNFDDERLLHQFNMDSLLSGVRSVYGKTKYLFLDEIQNVPEWELVVNRLQREGYNLVVTGSNANLLSRDLATHLTGRHIPIELLPFNFGEFMRAKVGTNFSYYELLEQYLRYGGFPEVVLRGADPKEYLGTLFDSLILKDVVIRHAIRKIDSVKRTGEYMITNAGQYFSAHSVARAIGEKSHMTVGKYISYFTDAYILVLLTRYSHSPKQRARAERKAYTIDNGFLHARAISSSNDSGWYFENLVFTEFLKRGYHTGQNIFYFKTKNGKEVDFVIKDGNTFSLVQCAYRIDDPKTEKREVSALLEAAKELQADVLTIITMDMEKEIQKDGKIIRVVSLRNWFKEMYKI